MKPEQIQRLFEAARNEAAPAAPADFERRVMRGLRQRHPDDSASWLDQLGNLLPRLATATVLALLLCAGADWCLANWAQTDLAASVCAISEHWLFAVN